MSITFSAQTSDPAISVYRLTCSVDGSTIGDYTGYRNAYTESQAHGLLCTDSLCQEYGADVDEVETSTTPIPVNLANRNACDVLRGLGLLGPDEDDMYGQMDPRTFLDLINAALAVGVTDNGLDPIEASNVDILPGVTALGKVYDCGRAPGYLTARLWDLATLAEKCLTAGTPIMWA